jgi:hypothetical protein
VRLFDGKTLGGWRAVTGPRFAGREKARVVDGQIVLEVAVSDMEGVRAEVRTGIAWTREFPKMNYEVRMNAMETASAHHGFCQFTFPVGSSACTLRAGAWSGVALSTVDGADSNANPTFTQMAFEPGRWYRLRLRVSRGRIEAWVDEQQVINLRTAGHRLAPWWPLDASRPFGVANHRGALHLRDIMVRPVRGPAARDAPEKPQPSASARTPGGWRGLFDGKSLDGWRVSKEGDYGKPGRVVVKDDAIDLGKGNPWTAIACTHEVPTDDYELDFEARRPSGGGDFANFVFPAGSEHGVARIGANGGGKLVQVRVKGSLDAAKGRASALHQFEQGRWYHFRLRVGRGRVELWLDGEDLLSVPVSRLSTWMSRSHKDLRPLGFFAFSTPSQLRNIRVRRLGP